MSRDEVTISQHFCYHVTLGLPHVAWRIVCHLHVPNHDKTCRGWENWTCPKLGGNYLPFWSNLLDFENLTPCWSTYPISYSARAGDVTIASTRGQAVRISCQGLSNFLSLLKYWLNVIRLTLINSPIKQYTTKCANSGVVQFRLILILWQINVS